MPQYPPPPPVATGPGLDRPLYFDATPSPDYGADPSNGHHAATSGNGYMMSRTRKFYQDQIIDSTNEGTAEDGKAGKPGYG
jgi:hypothetical protein